MRDEVPGAEGDPKRRNRTWEKGVPETYTIRKVNCSGREKRNRVNLMCTKF